MALEMVGGRERGSATLEAVILAPALLALVALVVFGGRVVVAKQGVEAAAAQAARSASIARTAGAAQGLAEGAAAATLANQDLRCVASSVTVDTSGFAAPVGTQAQISATVTCTVDLADLLLAGAPGTRVVRATMTSPLDTYRER